MIYWGPPGVMIGGSRCPGQYTSTSRLEQNITSVFRLYAKVSSSIKVYDVHFWLFPTKGWEANTWIDFTPPLLSIQVCCCPLQNFLPPSCHPSPLVSTPRPPTLHLNPVIFVENYTITKFLSLPWDNILVIAAAQELGQNQETSSAPVHHWSHFDMQIKQMQAFRLSL